MSVINTIDVQKLTDEEIIKLCLNSGNPKYFETIYDRYGLKIFQKCLSFTKDSDEAKDLAHDIIVKIYLSLSKFAGKSMFSTWIYSITYNYCVDNQAKKRKEQTLSEEIKRESTEIETVEPSDAELMEINIAVLHLLLDKIGVAEKSLLLMKYQDGLSIKEMVELTGFGESAIKMKLKRSKSKLIELYEKEQGM